jgi:Salmonella virulence plasmid 65kDa B protein
MVLMQAIWSRRRERMRIAALSACLLLQTLASAQPLLPFKSRELQEGRHFIQKHLGVPEVSESSGQLTESFKIEVPPARGPVPSIQLDYSSSAGGSEYGWGWELSIPVIERSRRFGVPRAVNDLYRFRNGHATAEIVPTGVTTPTGGAEYRERVERSFNRYIRYGNRWVILTPAGLRYELGDVAGARAGTSIGTLSGTFAWHATRLIDANNNFASFEYQNDYIGNPRIHYIRYGGNSALAYPAAFSVAY